MVRLWANDGKARGSAAPEPPGKANGKGSSETPNNAAGRPETNPPGATWVISGYPDSGPAAASPAWPGP